MGKTSGKERVFVENVSSRGLRVVTKSMWPPGARVRVSFASEAIDERARCLLSTPWQARGLPWGSNGQRT